MTALVICGYIYALGLILRIGERAAYCDWWGIS